VLVAGPVPVLVAGLAAAPAVTGPAAGPVGAGLVGGAGGNAAD
jgi:hypothetical protein